MTESPAVPDVRPSWRPLIVVALCLVGWLSVLATFTLLDGPIVVNQRQVRRADAVVSATISSVSEKRVRIQAVLAGEEPESAEMVVTNLDKVHVREGDTVIIPLWRNGKIVKVSNPDKPRLGGPVVYADNDDVRAQIESALKLGRIHE